MPKPLPTPRLCVFDLDGTLVDSLLDIAEAFNACLDLLGLPMHPPETYRYMVGEGVPTLCRRAAGTAHPHLVARLAELARPSYRIRVLRHTRPYTGVPELVERLFGRGLHLAVLSNKPQDLTERIVRSFWPDRFASIYGYREEQHRKPSPHYLLRICEEMDVAPAETWMIGDTPTDVETARAAGAISIGVTWGFRTREDLAAAGPALIVDAPAEL
jgi:phosphoglycolate phosphatase